MMVQADRLRKPKPVLRAVALASLATAGILQSPAISQSTEGRNVAELTRRPSESNAQIRHLAQQARLTRGGTKARLERIIDQIFSAKDGLGFTYQARPTLTAAEAVEARAGNCLSLVNLVVSIARSAGIKAEYVEVEDFETFYRLQGTIVRTTHIIAGVDVSGNTMYVDFLPRREKSYRQLRPISDRRAAALFYNALATEAMLGKDHDLASSYFLDAITVDSDSAETWNNFAILQRRQGNLDKAIENLTRAHALQPTLLPAIENLAGMYRRANKHDEARRFEALALDEKTKNPYFLLQQAIKNLENDEIAEAEGYLRRARRLEPDEPEIYVALGRVELAKGGTREANRYFDLARRKSEARTAGFQMLLKRKVERLLVSSEAQSEDQGD
jgi:tetratricopeptide (TPR) repeat protein